MGKSSKKIIASIVVTAIMCTLFFTNVYAVTETVTIDVGSNIGAADHKGNGLLLGVTATAPSDSIIAAIKPSSWRLCDKWDPISVSDRIMNIAGSNGYTTQIQDILSDYIFYNYGNTEKPGPFNTSYYTSATNQYLNNHQGHGLYAIDLFNEPDGWPYPQGALDTRAERSAYWNACYRAIRANPNYNNVKIMGPSTSGQSVGTVAPYLDDAYASGTYPDIISFHFPMHFPDNNNPESTIQAIRDYCASKGYPSRPIHINEDVWSSEWTYPGTVARVFGYAERMGVKVNHACWQDGNNNNGDWFPMLDGLVDMNGGTRPCYYMYKAYASMTGSMLNVTRSTNYDASASKDTGAKKVIAILGSMNNVSGTITARFTNMSSVFTGTSVNVLVQKLSAGTNIVSGPSQYSNGSVTISGNTVNVSVNVNSREGVIITLTSGSGATAPVAHMRKLNAMSFGLDGGEGGANDQKCKLWSYDYNNINQQWEEIDRGGGYYSYQKRGTNYCLDGGEGGANGQAVKLWTRDDNNQNQHWKKINLNNGNYRLEKRNAPGFSIDGGNGGANGQSVVLWTSDSNNQNQAWNFVY